METTNGAQYGWGTTGTGIDIHLSKNIEWGAVSYLSNSNYGKNSEININNNSSYLTGGGTGDSYVSNAAQSTTGNIYGIYDINGGSWEYVAAYVNNGNVNITNNGISLSNADNKYKDLYSVTTDNSSMNYANSSTQKGDAIFETSSSDTNSTSWYNDYSYMPYLDSPFFARGGAYYDSTNSGAFSFNYYNGSVNVNISFRPVLLVSNLLNEYENIIKYEELQ